MKKLILLFYLFPLLVFAQTKTPVYSLAANEKLKFSNAQLAFNEKGEIGYQIGIKRFENLDSVLWIQTPNKRLGPYDKIGSIYRVPSVFGVFVPQNNRNNHQVVSLWGESAPCGMIQECKTRGVDNWVIVARKDTFYKKTKRFEMYRTDFYPKTGKKVSLPGFGKAIVTEKGWVGISVFRGKGYYRNENGKIKTFPCESEMVENLSLLPNNEVQFSYQKDKNTQVLRQGDSEIRFSQENIAIFPANNANAWVKIIYNGGLPTKTQYSQDVATSVRAADSIMAAMIADSIAKAATTTTDNNAVNEEDEDTQKATAVKEGEEKETSSSDEKTTTLQFSNGESAEKIKGFQKQSLYYLPSQHAWYWITAEEDKAYLHNSKGEKWGDYPVKSPNNYVAIGDAESFFYILNDDENVNILGIDNEKFIAKKIAGKYKNFIRVNGKPYIKIAETKSRVGAYTVNKSFQLPNNQSLNTEMYGSASGKTYWGIWKENGAQHIWFSNGYTYSFPVLDCEYDAKTNEAVWLGVENDNVVYLYRMKVE